MLESLIPIGDETFFCGTTKNKRRLTGGFGDRRRTDPTSGQVLTTSKWEMTWKRINTLGANGIASQPGS